MVIAVTVVGAFMVGACRCARVFESVWVCDEVRFLYCISWLWYGSLHMRDQTVTWNKEQLTILQTHF